MNAWKTFAYFFGAPALNAQTQRAARPLDDTSPQLRRSARLDRWFVVAFQLWRAARLLRARRLARPGAVRGVLGCADAHRAAADPAPARDLRARRDDRFLVAADGGALESHRRRRGQRARARAAVSASRQLPPRAPSVSGGAALPPAAAARVCSPRKARSTAPRCAISARPSAWSSRRAPRARPEHEPGMSDLILHHYGHSPFSEKVRLVLGMKRPRVALGDGADDAAQARRRRADRRLPAHAVHADRRRHLLRLGADVPRHRPPRAGAAALSAARAPAWPRSSRNGPTRRSSGPRCRTRCSRPARRTSSPARRPNS